MAVTNLRIPYYSYGILDNGDQMLRNFQAVEGFFKGLQYDPVANTYTFTTTVSFPSGSTIAPWRLGTSIPYGSGFASLDYTARAFSSTGNYVLLASTVDTMLNAVSGGNVYVRVNNVDYAQFGGGGVVLRNGSGTDLMNIDTNTARSNFGFTSNQGSNTYFRGFGDTNHRIVVPGAGSAVPFGGTVFNVDGPSVWGFNNWTLNTGTNGHWQANVFANGFQVFGQLVVGNSVTNDSPTNVSLTDAESICLPGGGTPSGISFRQRPRGATDATNRCVVYADTNGANGGEGLFFWQGANMIHLQAGQNFHIPMGLPGLGGGVNMQYIGGSTQVGIPPSTLAYKDVVDRSSPGADNPLFQAQIARFHWNERVPNHADERARLPEGQIGLIAEEMEALAPELVHRFVVNPAPVEGSYLDPDYVHPELEEIVCLDDKVIMAYLVDAVNHLKSRLDALGGSNEPVRTGPARTDPAPT